MLLNFSTRRYYLTKNIYQWFIRPTKYEWSFEKVGAGVRLSHLRIYHVQNTPIRKCESSYRAHDYCQNWLTTWPKFHWRMQHPASFGYANFPSNEIPYTQNLFGTQYMRWVNTELFMLINYIELILRLYIVYQPFLLGHAFTPKRWKTEKLTRHSELLKLPPLRIKEMATTG